MAGQSVPHVHVHIMPRRSTDFDGVNDRVYPALEKAEQSLAKDFTDRPGVNDAAAKGGLTVADGDRKPRSVEEMEEEARWLSSYFGDPSEIRCLQMADGSQ